MYTNFFDKGFKDLLWRAAKSTHLADFTHWMEEIKKISVDAHGWLMKRHPSEWSKAHFLTKVNSDILVNNICEVFNKMILEDREKSVLTLLIDMHLNFMKRIRTRRDKMRRITGELCPKIQQKLHNFIEQANDCDVDSSGGHQDYVSCPGGEYVVDLAVRSCACRKWQLTGIPCVHAVAVIKDKMEDLPSYVHDCYKVSTYLSCYENIVNPINGMKLWPLIDGPLIQPPGWSIPQKGRKQRKRMMQMEEVISKKGGTSKLKKKGQVRMTCSICGLQGHNKKYHNRSDTPTPDLNGFNGDNEASTTQNRREKLVPQRAKSNLTINNTPLSSDFQFMPTPRASSDTTANFNDQLPPGATANLW